MLPAGAPKEEPTDEMVDEQTAPDEDAATEDQWEEEEEEENDPAEWLIATDLEIAERCPL